jgi:hypothetical protein
MFDPSETAADIELFSEFPKIRNRELISKRREVSRDIRESRVVLCPWRSRLSEPFLNEVSRA